MKNKLLLDTRSYDKKPTDKDAKIIQNTIFNFPYELAMQELLNEVIKGKTFKASYLTGKEGETFVSSSLLCIDIDNKEYKKQVLPSITFEKAKEILEEKHIKVAGAYTTFSSTEKWPKFRILIQLDKTITLLQEMKKLYAIIKGTFSFQDNKVSPVSLYFGGKKILYCDPTAVTKVSDIYKIYEENNAGAIDRTNFAQRTKKAAQSLTHNISDIDCVHNPNFEQKPVISTLKKHFFHEILKFYDEEGKCFDTFEAALTYVKSLPLDELLGLERSCYCIVHEDTKPSAGIFCYEDGSYHYHCFACGAIMDIVDFMAIFLNLDTQKDFIKICNVLNKTLHVKVINSEWKQGVEKQFMLSKKNLKFIDKYKATHPKAVKVLEYGDPVYRLLADECLISLEYIAANDEKGLPLTRASLRYIAKRTGLSMTKVRRRLEKLQQANFIRQLSDEETRACSNYFGKTARIHESNHYTINTYAVNYITNRTIEEAEACMIRFKESGATMRGMSAKQSLYIEGNNDTCVKSAAKEITQDEKVLLDWATRTLKRKKCFLKEAYIKYGLSKKIKKDTIERSITMITNKLELKRNIVSNEIIKKYNLSKNSLRKVVFHQ